MQLTLYSNTSDEKELFKALTKVGELNNIMWKENTNITKPVFTFHKSAQAGWKNFNYVGLKWSGFPTRFYFVRDLVVQPGGIVEIVCEEDYRYTWRKKIMAQHYLVARQEFINDKTIRDDRKVIPLTRQIDSKDFQKTVGDNGNGTIILTVSG